jgi:two-component system phosphate regulon sensor histidine kinase PhoR
MNTKLIRIMLIAISVALLGLIAIQANWVIDSYRVYEERFDQEVYMGLNNAAHDLEINEASNYFRDAGIPNLSNGVVQIIDTVQAIKQMDDNFMLIDSVGQHAMKFGFNDTTGNFVAKFFGTITFLQDQAEDIQKQVLDKNIIEDPIEKERKIIQNQFKKYNKFFEELAVRFMLDDKCLSERLDSQLIQQTLTEKFANTGISINYRYAVFDNFSDKKIFGNINVKEKKELTKYYSIPIFANDIYKNSGVLIVDFPCKTNYIIRSMWLIIITSLAFVMILVGAFGASFYIIFRQKKIDLLKNDFINNMTHEFKTPVATISLASQMLKEKSISEKPEKIARYAEMIEEENKRLSGHIENVLQAARFDRGEFKLKIEKIDINHLLNDIVESLRFRVENEDGTIAAFFNAQNPTVEGDLSHLSNGFYNVIENAIKYRKESSLKIEVSTKNTPKGVLISVKDNGIGISKENQRMVFDRFYRVPTGNIHNVKGFGLGLSYVKLIADAHQGKLTLESELNVGSRFDLFLPFRQQHS